MIYSVEDDQAILDLVLYALKQAEYEAEGFLEGRSFLEAMRRRLPRLILLDQMLPGISGGELLPLPEHLPLMAVETAKMVHKAIDAYVALDLILARSVMEDDDIVDGLFDEVKKDLMGQINSCCRLGINPNSMQLLDMLMIAKYFERSADHAVNIAEWVEFAVTGEYKGERLS